MKVTSPVPGKNYCEEAQMLIRNREIYYCESPKNDPWGFLMHLSFDLAEYLYWSRDVLQDEYRPGASSPEAEELEILDEQFGRWPVEALLGVANGPLHELRQSLRDLGLDY